MFIVDLAATATATAPPACPQCAAPMGGRICLRDGTIAGREPVDVGGRYRVEVLLESDPIALVFAARNTVLGRPVTLKVLRAPIAHDHEMAERFLCEARIASRLDHENIVSLVDVGTDAAAGVSYVVTEGLSGVSLAELIGLPFEPGRVVRILVQLARALAAAHAVGIAHGGVRPHNIVLTASSRNDEHVKLCNFGFAALDETTPTEGVTEAADLHGFGRTAYAMLFGEEPPDALTSLPAVVLDAPMPEALEDMVMRCLAAHARDRPTSAAELVRGLEELVHAAGTTLRCSPTLVGTLIGGYQVTRLIGTGPVGSVVLAEHPLFGTKVAVKVLRPELSIARTTMERFVEHVRTAHQLESSRFARYLDVGSLPSGQPYMVMEYVEGESLRVRIDRTGVMAVKDVVDLLTQVASVLERAHGVGLVHGDLKPENLLLSRDAHGGELVKLLDVGTAELCPIAAGSAVGLRFSAHDAPEQADVYAIGAIAFEMLTGRPPFAAHISASPTARTAGDAPRVSHYRPDASPRIDRSVAAMLTLATADRIQTMSEVVRELAAWEDGAALPAAAPTADRGASEPHLAQTDRAETASKAPTAPTHHRRWRWILATLVVVAGIVVAALVLFNPAGPTRAASSSSATVTPPPASASARAPAAVPAPPAPAAVRSTSVPPFDRPSPPPAPDSHAKPSSDSKPDRGKAVAPAGTKPLPGPNVAPSQAADDGVVADPFAHDR